MMRMLKMKVEGGLAQLFELVGGDLKEELVNIFSRWRDENYMGLVDSCGVFIIDHDRGGGFDVLLAVDFRGDFMLQALVQHLTNRVVCGLAVIFDRLSGGDQCHLIDLHFDIVEDRLE